MMGGFTQTEQVEYQFGRGSMQVYVTIKNLIGKLPLLNWVSNTTKAIPEEPIKSGTKSELGDVLWFLGFL